MRMAHRLSFLPGLRVWTLLLLAAIGMQAAEPIHAPLERTQGSAWSSATLDLALAAQRKDETQATQPNVQPVDLLQPRASVGTELAQAAFVPQPRALLPDARAPPPRRHPARPPSSTAPPLS